MGAVDLGASTVDGGTSRRFCHLLVRGGSGTSARSGDGVLVHESDGLCHQRRSCENAQCRDLLCALEGLCSKGAVGPFTFASTGCSWIPSQAPAESPTTRRVFPRRSR